MRNVLIKVGGSLLTLPDLPDRIQKLFDTIAADQVLLLGGGGQMADIVRGWDEIHRLDLEVAHWLAIDAMGLNATLLAKLLPESRLVAGRTSVDDSNPSTRFLILDPRPVIREASSYSGAMLPLGWNCTSDSIAAWIASRWNVDSLVLAKSVDIPSENRLSDPSQSAAVDPCFSSVVTADLPVYWCNVRTSPESVELWKPVSRE